MKNFFSCAKWILSGEHAVVRGKKAIAFPLHCYKNSVSLEDSDHFSLHSDSEYSENTIISLFEIASRSTGILLENIRGKFTVTNSIPTKVGFGSSAAICVNVAKIFEYYGFCGDVLALARHLEDKFHKKSSGLDVSVLLKNKPLVFKNNEIVDVIKPAFWPHLILSYSGEKSVTSHCVELVQKIFLENERLAQKLDDLMDLSSDLCEDALKNANFDKLKDGIKLGYEVFYRWGLCNESLKYHIDVLLSEGAVAAKPIGSGWGGYVVSLWDGKPKHDIYLTLEGP